MPYNVLDALNLFRTQTAQMPMYKLLSATILSLCFVGFSSDACAQDPDFHIYLCFGQSNMQGSAKIEAQDKTTNDRFWLLQSTDSTYPPRTKGQWIPADPPLCREGTGLGPANSFGKTMIKHLPSNIKVGIVHVAVAGCKIELFDKDQYQDFQKTHEGAWFKKIIDAYDGNPYAHLLELAKKAQEKGVIKGVLLHQGESNTGEEDWPSKVKVIYDDLMQDLSLDPATTPLLAGEVVHADYDGCCSKMNITMSRLPETIPNSYVISSKGCAVQPDKTHFNSEGVRLLGKRYALKMLATQGITVDENGKASHSSQTPTPAAP